MTDARLTTEKVHVCDVAGQPYYGSQLEYDAARLRDGDKVIVDGVERIVDYVMFYEGINVKLKDGTFLYPSLRDKFEVVK